MDTKNVVDLSVLFKTPNFIKSELTIYTPVPISISNSPYHSYHMFDFQIHERMLAGLFENLLEFHFSDGTRKDIIKDLVNGNFISKNKCKSEVSRLYKMYDGLPLIEHLFEILEVKYNHDNKELFSDSYTKHIQRISEYPHFNGSKSKTNILEEIYVDRPIVELVDSPYYGKIQEIDKKLKDVEEKKNIEKNKNKIIDEENKKDKNKKKDGLITNEIINELLKDSHIKSNLPSYYTSVSTREWLITDKIILTLDIDSELYDKIEASSNKDLIYLGTSEGFVYISIKKI